MLKAKKSDSVNIISNRIHRHLNISSLQSYDHIESHRKLNKHGLLMRLKRLKFKF